MTNANENKACVRETRLRRLVRVGALHSQHWWLLHDNDPGRHQSHVLRNFMHTNYIRPLDFPPYSPDLNPIENLWAEMDKLMDSTQAETKKELESLINTTLTAIPRNFFRKLALSMPKRIAQVIERNGAYTDF